jgi:hypothetical protein
MPEGRERGEAGVHGDRAQEYDRRSGGVGCERAPVPRHREDQGESDEKHEPHVVSHQRGERDRRARGEQARARCARHQGGLDDAAAECQ